MADPLHVNLVDEALNSLTEEQDVRMTGGELILYHCLLQDYGIALTGEERFIPLMERSAARL